MTHAPLNWLYPPDAAPHFAEAEPAIRIRGAGEDWSVLRYYRVELHRALLCGGPPARRGDGEVPARVANHHAADLGLTAATLACRAARFAARYLPYRKPLQI